MKYMSEDYGRIKKVTDKAFFILIFFKEFYQEIIEYSKKIENERF